MLIQQTHFPQSGPNWGKMTLIAAGITIIGIILYNAVKPENEKI